MLSAAGKFTSHKHSRQQFSVVIDEKVVDQVLLAFPSFDRDDIVATLVECNGSVDQATEQLLTWTDESGQEETEPTSVWLGPVHEPHVKERRTYDRIMEARFHRHCSPAQFNAEVEKAIIIFKRRAHHVHTYCEQRHKGTSIAHKLHHQRARAESHSIDKHPYTGHGRGEADVDGEIENGRVLLKQRLDFMKLSLQESIGDGNCQFRSLSQELYGTQEHHPLVRNKAVSFMIENSSEYRVFFESDAEWQDYIMSMSKLMTWGDELTLRACADAYGVTIHVITTTVDNWHLHYVSAHYSLPMLLAALNLAHHAVCCTRAFCRSQRRRFIHESSSLCTHRPSTTTLS